MVSLLLLMSFLLHIILIVAVYQLFQQLQQLKENEQHIQTALAKFLEKLKEENDRLEQQLEESQKNIKTEDKQRFNPDKNSNPLKIMKQYYHDDQHNIPPPDQIETSLESKILQLSQKGLTVEEIAKKLNKGKTEVELILKLKKL